MSGKQYFIPGRSRTQLSPLSRYLPPVPQGQISTWLKEHIIEGSWILDPFGSCPALVVEAAQAGYKVMTAVNNPILRLLMEIEASAPSEVKLRASLSDLAASYKGEERIELHIRRLYETICKQCGGMVEADCFLWEKGATYPYARIYTCPHCGDSGERDITQEDRDKALEFSSSGLHRARALERVAPKGDPDREHAVDALSVYLPRAVYALFTIINKLNALSLTVERRQHLDALVLHACDRANTLWPHPTQRGRPRQLTIPPKFRENNLWMALEEAVKLYAGSLSGGVPYAIWPDNLSSENGVLLFHGRLKDLAEKQGDIICEAAYAALPRPNQAFWTLSALWSGWLWGRESAAPIRTVLRRKRYDWAWHSGALSAVFAHLQPLLIEKAPFFSILEETEPGMLSAVLTAGKWNGFDIEGIALRAEAARTQIHFRLTDIQGELELSKNIDNWTALAKKAAHDYLKQRGQPSPYLPIHAASLYALTNEVVLTRNNSIKPNTEESLRPMDYFNQIQTLVKEALTFRGGFLHFEGSLANPEAGQWWLKNPAPIDTDKPSQLPLADRVEKTVVQTLVTTPVVAQNDLEEEICKLFPGLLTPELSLIMACLKSYAYKEAMESDDWQLKAEDNPNSRWKDLKIATESVLNLGRNLGYFPEMVKIIPSPTSSQMRFRPTAWLDQKREILYIFYFSASAIISNIINIEKSTAKKRVLVIPPERSDLLFYKLNYDPGLKETIKNSWVFLNFYQLEKLLENPLTTRKTFEESLSRFPLVESEPQLRML
jgi:hypothetical protein